MIDFAKDGPLGMEAVEVPMSHATIGIGSGAVNIIDQIRMNDEKAGHCYVIDTDEQCIRGSVVSEKFLLGKRRVYGLGCGGDRVVGERLWVEQEAEISEMLGGIETAFVVVSLGGGTGSACSPQLVHGLKANGVRVVVFAVTPFSFEGERRRSNAAVALKELHKEADAVFVFSNERTLHLTEAEQDVRICMHEVNKLVAGLTESLRRMVSERGFSQVTWSDIVNMGEVNPEGVISLETGWAGTGEACGESRLRQVVLEALQSPLFEDGKAWQYADKAFAGLIGGSDFSMSEYQSVVRLLKEDLPDGFSIASGALVDPSMEGRLRLTLLFSSSAGNPELEVAGSAGVEAQRQAESRESREESGKEDRGREVDFGEWAEQADSGEGEHASDELGAFSPHIGKTDFSSSYVDSPGGMELSASVEEDLFGESSGQAGSQKYFIQQEELQLEQKISRGRFEKTERTILNGQDLDQPTFQRMKVSIRL